MKNLKFLFGIVVIAAIIFVSCGGDDALEPGTPCTVTLYEADGTTILSVIDAIAGETTLAKPEDVKEFTNFSSISAAGLYKAYYQATDWKVKGKPNDPVVTWPLDVDNDLELVATALTPPTAITAIGDNNFDTVFGYINVSPNKYLFVTSGGTVAGGGLIPALTKTNFELTIKGASNTTNVTFTGNGPYIKFGQTVPAQTNSSTKVASTAKVTLTGISLTGANNNNGPVVHVQNGAVLTMEAGSKITGNSSSGAGSAYGAAVYVEMGDFVLAGGEVTGNTSTYSVANAQGRAIGGVLAFDYASLDLQSGSIKNNNGVTPDVYVQGTSKIKISGTADIGEITLGTSTNNASYNYVTITTSGTGYTVGQINLRADSGTGSGIGTLWNNKPILYADEGASLTAAIVAKFHLGVFIPNDGTRAGNNITGYKISDTTGPTMGFLQTNS